LSAATPYLSSDQASSSRTLASLPLKGSDRLHNRAYREIILSLSKDDCWQFLPNKPKFPAVSFKYTGNRLGVTLALFAA
jgi:hypothetical protein